MGSFWMPIKILRPHILFFAYTTVMITTWCSDLLWVPNIDWSGGTYVASPRRLFDRFMNLPCWPLAVLDIANFFPAGDGSFGSNGNSRSGDEQSTGESNSMVSKGQSALLSCGHWRLISASWFCLLSTKPKWSFGFGGVPKHVEAGDANIEWSRLSGDRVIGRCEALTH